MNVVEDELWDPFGDAVRVGDEKKGVRDMDQRQSKASLKCNSMGAHLM